MVPYKYSYLIGCTVFFFVWLILFKNKPKYRMEMLFLGFFGMVFGPIANYFFYLEDWWRPLYITGTRGGIEDFILGFTNLGIASVLYEEIFNKKYNKSINSKKLDYFIALKRIFVFITVTLVPVLILSFVFNLHSFWSHSVGLIAGGFFVLLRRPDLIKDSLWSAFLMPIVSMPAFLIPELLSPGWIDKYWMMENLSRITLLAAPLEDVIWYILIGFCMGGLFEYLFDFKIKDSKK